MEKKIIQKSPRDLF